MNKSLLTGLVVGGIAVTAAGAFAGYQAMDDRRSAEVLCVEPLTKTVHDLPAEIDHIVQKSLQEEPDRRYSDAAHFYREVEEVLNCTRLPSGRNSSRGSTGRVSLLTTCSPGLLRPSAHMMGFSAFLSMRLTTCGPMPTPS